MSMTTDTPEVRCAVYIHHQRALFDHLIKPLSGSGARSKLFVWIDWTIEGLFWPGEDTVRGLNNYFWPKRSKWCLIRITAFSHDILNITCRIAALSLLEAGNWNWSMSYKFLNVIHILLGIYIFTEQWLNRMKLLFWVFSARITKIPLQLKPALQFVSSPIRNIKKGCE